MNPGGIGRMLVFLALQGLLYFICLFAIEFGFFQMTFYALQKICRRERFAASGSESQRLASILNEDDDVLEERRRTDIIPIHSLLERSSVLVKNLQKTYGDLVAVDQLSFGVDKGECFGLLGINGAGKTSTFQMLTGDEMINSGEVFIEGFDIKRNLKKIQQRIGYCPQFDALVDQLTGRETLYHVRSTEGRSGICHPADCSESHEHSTAHSSCR